MESLVAGASRFGRRGPARLVLTAVCVLYPAVAQAGRLYVVTRADHANPHVACVFRYDGGEVVWLHFRPAERSVKKVASRPVPGVLDTCGFDAQVNHLIGFDVPDATLHEAERIARVRFTTGTDYDLYERDCVTLAVAVCRQCQLRVKPNHFTPKNLLLYLRKHNAHTDCVFNLDHKKHAGYVLPWRPATSGPLVRPR